MGGLPGYFLERSLFLAQINTVNALFKIVLDKMDLNTANKSLDQNIAKA